MAAPTACNLEKGKTILRESINFADTFPLALAIPATIGENALNCLCKRHVVRSYLSVMPESATNVFILEQYGRYSAKINGVEYVGDLRHTRSSTTVSAFTFSALSKL